MGSRLPWFRVRASWRLTSERVTLVDPCVDTVGGTPSALAWLGDTVGLASSVLPYPYKEGCSPPRVSTHHPFHVVANLPSHVTLSTRLPHRSPTSRDSQSRSFAPRAGVQRDSDRLTWENVFSVADQIPREVARNTRQPRTVPDRLGEGREPMISGGFYG